MPNNHFALPDTPAVKLKHTRGTKSQIQRIDYDPGTGGVHPAVLEALRRSVEPHYGPTWVDKYSRIGLLKGFITRQDLLMATRHLRQAPHGQRHDEREDHYWK
jgi:hypothetical protein